MPGLSAVRPKLRDVRPTVLSTNNHVPIRNMIVQEMDKSFTYFTYLPALNFSKPLFNPTKGIFICNIIFLQVDLFFCY